MAGSRSVGQDLGSVLTVRVLKESSYFQSADDTESGPFFSTPTGGLVQRDQPP